MYVIAIVILMYVAYVASISHIFGITSYCSGLNVNDYFNLYKDSRPLFRNLILLFKINDKNWWIGWCVILWPSILAFSYFNLFVSVTMHKFFAIRPDRLDFVNYRYIETKNPLFRWVLYDSHNLKKATFTPYY
ncbi:MAG: hypothetical protein ACRC4M_01285 [Mycoplasma sp.]